MLAQEDDDSHIGEQVLIVFYESFIDKMPLAQNSKPECDWTNNVIKYDLGYIIRGRSYLLGRRVTFAYDTMYSARNLRKPYCEINPPPSSSPSGQFMVKHLRIWRDGRRPLTLSDQKAMQILNREKEWVYGATEISPAPLSLRQLR